MRHLSPLSLATVMAVTGCGPHEEEPPPQGRRAVVTLDGRWVDFTIEPCEIDGETWRITGRSEADQTLQVVVVVEPDGRTGVPEESSIRMTDLDGADVAAFGAEAWAQQDATGEHPGDVRGARIEVNDLVRLGGELDEVDGAQRPIGDARRTFSLDAYCDEG